MVSACAVADDHHSSLFGAVRNPEWGSAIKDSKALAASWVEAQTGLGRAQKALEDYVNVAGAATAGTFGWFLRDEHRHTREQSYGPTPDPEFPLTLDATKPSATAELIESNRKIEADAGKGPVDACIKRVKRKLIIETVDEVYKPHELEQERDTRKNATAYLYKLCEMGIEMRQQAAEARARLAAARAKVSDAVEVAAKHLGDITDYVTSKADMEAWLHMASHEEYDAISSHAEMIAKARVGRAL